VCVPAAPVELPPHHLRLHPCRPHVPVLSGITGPAGRQLRVLLGGRGAALSYLQGVGDSMEGVRGIHNKRVSGFCRRSLRGQLAGSSGYSWEGGVRPSATCRGWTTHSKKKTGGLQG
jgi:hypothetical protein